MHMPTINDEIVALDAQAVRASVELVSRARGRDMTAPTPCPDWTLHGLVAHMTAQHYGFAAAAVGDGDLARWRPRRLSDDPVADYRAAADTVLYRVRRGRGARPPVPAARIRGLSRLYPAHQAISFHFVDYVVHSWDVAKTLGLEARFPADLLEVALRVALAVPDGDNRLAPGAAFAPSLGVGGGSPLDLIVAILGRSPDWKRPALLRERAMLAKEGEQCLVVLGFGFQVGQVPGAVDGDELGPLEAGDDLGCHRGGGPRVRGSGHDEGGDVQVSEQRPVVGPAAAAAQRRGGSCWRGGGHHGIDAGTDGGRASRAVEAGVHVVHQDSYPVALDRVGPLVPGPLVLRRGRLRRRGDEPEGPAPLRRGDGEFHGHQAAHAQADHRGPADPQFGEQFRNVGGVLPHRHAPGRDRAGAEAPQVGREHPEAAAQRGLPAVPTRSGRKDAP